MNTQPGQWMWALSLHEPWATLVAIEAKRLETRHWRPPQDVIGKPLAIHAAKRWTPAQRVICKQPYFEKALQGSELTFGAVVCTCTITRVFPITPEFVAALTDQERAYGNYAIGRYAWELSRVQRVLPPVPLKGQQGFFVWGVRKHG